MSFQKVTSIYHLVASLKIFVLVLETTASNPSPKIQQKLISGASGTCQKNYFYVFFVFIFMIFMIYNFMIFIKLFLWFLCFFCFFCFFFCFYKHSHSKYINRRDLINLNIYEAFFNATFENQEIFFIYVEELCLR